MSKLHDSFSKALGDASPKVPPALAFTRYNPSWDLIKSEIGAGWFLDRFVYLFGDGLEPLKACLDAWSFVVPPHADRKIIGRNAYGAILVLEDGEDLDKESVHVLDPVNVDYKVVRYADAVAKKNSR